MVSYICSNLSVMPLILNIHVINKLYLYPCINDYLQMYYTVYVNYFSSVLSSPIEVISCKHISSFCRVELLSALIVVAEDVLDESGDQF